MASNAFENQASTNYKEAFSLFDKHGNGRVALDSLGDLLRACGQNPTLAEIRELEKTVGGDCKQALLSKTEHFGTDIFGSQSISRRSRGCSTDPAASATLASPRSTAEASRSLTRT